jgi:hypothetical protein
MSDNPTSESIDSPVPSDITKFRHGPSTVTALVERATTVDSQFKEFNKRLAKAEIDLGQRIERSTREIENLRGTLSENQRRSALEKAVNGHRREVVAATDESRFEVLKAMARAEEEILAVESQFASPAHILMRAGLGSEERSRYLSQIAAAGPMEIQNYAAHAVANGDKVLAASILSKLDSMNRRDRELSGVNRQQLAEALAGADYTNAQAAIQRVKNRLREAMANNRSFMNGRKVSINDRIGLALKRGAEVGADNE